MTPIGDRLGPVLRVAASRLRAAARRGRGGDDVDLALGAWLAGDERLGARHDPAAYVAFLRACVEPLKFSVEVVKDGGDTDDTARRFTTLSELLTVGLPSMGFEHAGELAATADDLSVRTEPISLPGWAGDAGLHSRLSSSGPSKARLLAAAVRVGRPRQLLELGTAYGMSALFLLQGLDGGGRLTTVEFSEPQFAIASRVLALEAGRVEARKGECQQVLPQLVAEGRRFDFMFHDALHAGEAYVEDFATIRPALEAGATVVFDDIRWEDPRFGSPRIPCYEGWSEVVARPDVRRAIEVDRSVGILLVE